MPVDAKRDRAIGLIRTMQDIVDRSTTSAGEREAAKSRIEALRKKHNITTPPPRFYQPTDWSTRDFIRRRAAEDDARVRREAEEKAKRDAEAIRMRKAAEATKRAREDAQRRLREEDARRKQTQPMTETERREAQRDPLGWATKQDRRTQKEKQQDINSTWGKAPYTGQARSNERDREAARKFTDDNIRKAKERDAQKPRWDTSTKYNARIRSAEIKKSKAGNDMVEIGFVCQGSKFRGYYVLTNETGLRNLMAVVSTLLGPAATQMAMDTMLNTLVGQACTIMLQTWTTSDGEEKFSVQTVMKPWA